MEEEELWYKYGLLSYISYCKMAQHKDKLHVVMFPWLGFGHMINFLELSKFIAQKGHRVSFVSTPRNIHRLPPILNPLPNFTFVKLNLPKVEGLPESAESTMDIATSDIPILMKATDGLEPEFTQFLDSESPDWIIYDFTAYWVPQLAAERGISKAFFATYNAWFMCFIGSSYETMINDTGIRKTAEDFLVPPPWITFPSKVAYRIYEFNWVARAATSDTASGVSMRFRMGSAIGGSDAILIRHSLEFEPEWLPLFEKLHNKPVIPVGLLPPSMQDSRDAEGDETWLTIKEWLDSQAEDSVVYVALGSEVPLSEDQLTELALGLELSGLPFFWALRTQQFAKSTESHSLLPDGFLERTKGRGMVSTSWVPQLKILSHDSVGGFLTHCGWGSVAEGIMYGHPLIMLPLLADQGINARVLADKKLGIEVPRNELDGSFKRNWVAKSVSLVMVEEEGRIYRDKGKEMCKINGDKELHERYRNNVVNYLETHRPIKISI